MRRKLTTRTIKRNLKIMSNKSGVGEQEIKNRFESVMLPSLRENAVDIINSKSNEPISLFPLGNIFLNSS